MKKARYNEESSMKEGFVDTKEIFSNIKRYHRSILITTLFATLLALVYGYFTTDIYKSEILIKLAEDKQTKNPNFEAIVLGKNIQSPEVEMVVFKTRYLAEKALEDINLGIRYFTKKNLKDQELYKDAPFIVTFEYLSNQAMEVPIQLIPEGKEHFRLIIEPTIKEKVVNNVRSLIESIPADEQPIVYDKRHKFGEKIETSWFSITVQQMHELKNDTYFFTMFPNELMTDFIGENLFVSSYAEDGAIVSLSFEDNIPLRAKEILEALTSAYVRENMRVKSDRKREKLHFIDMQLESISKRLQGSAENLEHYKATNIVVDLGAKAQLTAGKLSELETQLYDINMQIDVLGNTLNYIKTHQDIRGINITSTQQLSENENDAIGSIILEIQKAIALHSDVSSDFKAAHPNVIKVNRQLASLRISLKNAIESSLRTLNQRKQSLYDIIKENKSKMQTLPAQERKLARLTRNFMVNDKIYSFLLEKRAETAVIESSTVSETRILEYPAIEELPIKPKRGTIIFLGFILGFIIGILQAILRAYLDNTVKKVEDIEKLTAIPIYGSIPFLHSKKGFQPYREALRVIRTNLEFLQNTGRSKVITVTSSIPGEGKSTTITELGKIIAEGNKKVIILDMDMRNPTVYEKLNFSNNIGISTLLSGKHSLEEVIQKIEDTNLSCITSGPIPPNPSELIISDRLTEVIEELKSTYDYILLDSPPIGLVTDAMIIMHMSDLNLIVLRANYSKKEFISNINQFVDDHDLNAGIILNGVELKEKAGYGYGYGYDYGINVGNDYYK